MGIILEKKLFNMVFLALNFERERAQMVIFISKLKYNWPKKNYCIFCVIFSHFEFQ